MGRGFVQHRTVVHRLLGDLAENDPARRRLRRGAPASRATSQALRPGRRRRVGLAEASPPASGAQRWPAGSSAAQDGSITHDVWPCGTWRAAPSMADPWLAPTPTPEVQTPIDSHAELEVEPCRHVVGIRLVRAGSARAEQLQRLGGRAPTRTDWPAGASTALDRVIDGLQAGRGHQVIGAPGIAAASSTMTRGTIRRWPKLSLMLLRAGRRSRRRH